MAGAVGPLRSSTSSSRAGPHLGTLALAGSSRASLSPGRAAPDTTSRAGLHRAAPSGSSQTGLHLGKVALGKVVLLGSPLASGSRSSSRRALGSGRMPEASGSRAGWDPGGAAPGSSRAGLQPGKARLHSSMVQGATLARAAAGSSLDLVVVGGAAAGLESHKATPVYFDISIQR